MSEQVPSNDRSKQPLDRDHLPDEFTAEFLEQRLPRDLVWLEQDASLNPQQRNVFKAWVATKHFPKPQVNTLAKAVTQQRIASRFLPEPSILKKLGVTAKPWWAPRPPATDPLGDEVHKSLEALRETVTNYEQNLHDTVSMTDSAVIELNGRKSAIPADTDEPDYFAQQIAASQQMVDFLAKMAARADAQQEEAEEQRARADHQKLITYATLAIAVASMIAAFAAVKGDTLAVAIAAAVFGCLFLYIFIHRRD